MSNNSEQMLLAANETMLNSKGFILFVCHQDGGLEMIESTAEMSQAETRGLRSWSNYYENVQDDEESDIGGF
jgi:hypothetical protein